MAKKDFGNIGKNTNLSGGGIGNLIPDMDKKVAVLEIQPKEIELTETPRTFFMIVDDYKFLMAYARYMAFHSKTKYPIKRAVADAVRLLREKHPDVERD